MKTVEKIQQSGNVGAGMGRSQILITQTVVGDANSRAPAMVIHVLMGMKINAEMGIIMKK